MGSSPLVLRIGNEILDRVVSFQYLGSEILPNGQAKDEIKVRIDKARKAFMQLYTNLWKRNEISLKTKLRVFQASVRPVLIYGCETWPVRAEDIRKLESFDHWCLRIIAKVKWSDMVSNVAVRKRCCNIAKIGDLLRKRRLEWFGHVVRRDTCELAKQTMNPKPKRGWKCRLGGQLKTWLATVKEDVEKLGLEVVYGVKKWKGNWVSICSKPASDRRAWRASIRDVLEAD